jgi:hypothetical protein
MRVSKVEAAVWLLVGGLALRAACGGDCLLWQLVTYYTSATG